MKHYLKILILALVISCAPVFAQVNRTVSNNHYEYDDNLTVTGKKSIVKTTDVKELAPNVTLTVSFYESYNQAVFKIDVQYEKFPYNEDEVETFFKNSIEQWITEKDHRYYSYLVNKRSVFHSRKDAAGNKIVSTEYKVVLYKN